MSHACTEHGISERRACQLVNQPRGTQRYRPIQRDDEDSLTRAIIALATHTDAMATAGSRRCCEATRLACWPRPGRAHLAPRRAEGSSETKATRTLVLNDGSCVRLRPEHANHSGVTTS